MGPNRVADSDFVLLARPGRLGHLERVSSLPWRDNVGALFIEVGRALAGGQSRQASVALGTALAYLDKARASGDPLAASLLEQLSAPLKEDRTERFSFAPGELEKIVAREQGDR